MLTIPLAVVGLVMLGAALLMVRLSVAVPVPLALVALNVTVELPAVVGVPEIKPPIVSTVRPEDSPVAP